MPAGAVLLNVALAAAGPPASVQETRAGAQRSEETSSARWRDEWLLTLEGVTRVPIDVGAQVGVETPFGLRVFGGYGRVPYIGMVAGVVVDASDRNVVTAFLDRGHASGDSGRVVVGWRPFRRIGVTIDGTYAHLRLDARLTIPPTDFQGLEFPGGTYHAQTSVDLWGLELGYQREVAERLVLGAAAGVTGSLDSRTSITPSGGAPNDPVLPAAAKRVDRAFRTHVIPTLTLRVGFDAI